MNLISNTADLIKKSGTKGFLWGLLFDVYRTQNFLRGNFPVEVFEVPQHKLLYIRVQKAGCTTVKNAMSILNGRDFWDDDLENFHRATPGRQISQRRLKSVIESEYKSWFVFTVVREPISRFLSLYNDNQKKVWERDVEDVVLHFKRDAWFVNPHGIPQSVMFGNDVSYVDRIWTTPELNDLLHFLSEKTGIPLQKGERNRSQKKISSLPHHLEVVIRNTYKKDYELFKDYF